MLILVWLILVGFPSNTYVNCVKNFWSQKQTNLQRFSNLLDNLDVCQVGCVMNDPQSRPRIDDQGRNLRDPFSVISTSFVIEVIGSDVGLVGNPFRVMVSDQTLSKNFNTLFELQSLALNNGELIQRITFNLNTEFEITSHSKRREVFTVKIPQVVPHVILVYDYNLGQKEEEATGVVLVGVSDYPQTVEVEVVRDDDGRCRIKSLDRKVFKNYLISVKVRGKNRHVLGKVSTIMQEKLIEDGFPFEIYMNQINEFVARFLKEALLQENNVIKKNKILNDFCNIISNEPFRPPFDHDSSSSGDSTSRRKDSSSSSEDNPASGEESSSSRDDNNPSSREDSSSSRGNSCGDNPCRDRCKCRRRKCKKNPCSNYKDCSRKIKIRIKV